MRALAAPDLDAARAGSYYTICGAGGPLFEWIEGYENLMRERIGKPQEWFRTTGAEVNTYAISKKGRINSEDLFQPGLVILLFPLDGLDVGRLAMFRTRMGDRWFDDIVLNMRRA